MKVSKAIILFPVLLAACGGPEEARTEAGRTPAKAETTQGESRRASAARTDEHPCAPLQARFVRYDTAGKPFFFTFEIPEGFTVKEQFTGNTAVADVTLNVDGKGIDEFVLRLMQSSDTMDNPTGLVEVWRKQPLTDAVLEKTVDGQTMFVQRARMGETTSYTALFPSSVGTQKAHMVMGGVTAAPKPCRAEAAEVIERMLMSIETNPEVVAALAPPA
jgi:hypothetical protein